MPKKNKRAKKLAASRFSVPTLTLILSVFVLAGVLILFIARAATEKTFSPADEKKDVSRINTERKNRSKSTLTRSQCLTDSARRWSRQMAYDGTIYHDTNDHRQAVVDRYCGTDWTVIGENVGYGPSEQAIFDAFMNSTDHRSNILYSDFKVVGVGIFYLDETFYITQIFARCTDCKSEWKTAPGDYCAPTTSYAGLLANDSFELDAITAKDWNDVKTTGRWYQYRSDGDTMKRESPSGKPQGDCYVLYLRDINAGKASLTQLYADKDSSGNPVSLAGRSYTLSGWYKYVTHAGNQRLIIEFLNSNLVRIDAPRVYTDHSTSWKKLSLTKTAPSGTRYIRVIIFGSSEDSQASNFYWDNIQLQRN